MADSPKLADFIARQTAGGVKGFVIGEEHTSVGLPNMLSAQMASYKAAGIATLFVEHVPADQQTMLSEALAGKPAAQRALYTHMLGHWHTDEAATARYNLMFAARDAGMRVVGIDTSSANEHLMRATATSVNDMRFAMGDAFMAREIIREHKDKPFMVLAGAAHVGRDGDESVMGSAHGSIDKRLAAAGIKTIAILADNQFTDIPDFTLVSSDEPDGVYQLSVPDKPQAGKAATNLYARTGTGLGYLQKNFAQLVKGSGAVVTLKDVRAIQQQLDAASMAFNACADAKKIASLYAPVKTYTAAVVPDSNDDAAYYLRTVVENMDRLISYEEVDKDRADLCKPGAEAKWLRPVAKPPSNTHN